MFLDTNVVSELMEHASVRNANVSVFFASRPVTDLYIPSIVVAEIRYGIEQLPPGKRRRDIDRGFSTFLESGFADRIVAFDLTSAQAYAHARATRKKSGRPVQTEDALIGGMALAYGATLTTRNTTDFDGYGLKPINPSYPQKPKR